MTLLVLLVLDKHLNGVAHLQVRVVTELVKRNDAVRLSTDVDHHLALVDRDDSTFGYFLVTERAKALVVGFFQFIVRFVFLSLALLKGVPIEIGDWRID